MAVYRRSSRTRTILLLLILISVTLITLDTRGTGGTFKKIRGYAGDAAHPFQSAVHAVLQPIGNFFTGAIDYSKLERENQSLREQVASAQAAQIQAADEKAQAEQVLGQEHLDFVGQIPTVAARVTDFGSGNFENSVQINRGSSSGLVVGQPVVVAQGLVGSVVAVTTSNARVLLLNDPSFTVGVRLDPSGATGVATGEGSSDPLRVDNVNVGVPLAKGQPLVTSGAQLEHFPPGIPVGKILSVSTTPGALQQQVVMKPLVSLNDLQFVQVMLWSPQTGTS